MSGGGPHGGWSPTGQTGQSASHSGSSAPEMPPRNPQVPPIPTGDSVSEPVPFRRPMPPAEPSHREEELAPDRSELDPATESLVEQFERARQEESARTMIDRAEVVVEKVPELGPTGRPMPVLPEPEQLTKHGPARVVSMTNQKGGVGKTTTTINLGASLAEYGRKVLLVDFDPQGSLSVGLGLNPHEMELTIYNLLMQRDVRIEDVVVPTNVEGMDLLPSNIDLSAAEVQLVHEVAREQTLQRVLAPALAKYDVILIDCQPSLGLLTVNALTASDGVIVPLECEYFALRGVALLKNTIDKVRERLNPKLEIDGVLGTMFDGRTLHGREVMERLVQAWGDRVFHTVIRRTVKFSDSTVAGEPITSYASTSTGAEAYRQLAKEVLARWPRPRHDA
jgi:chromosome partitioning protein